MFLIGSRERRSSDLQRRLKDQADRRRPHRRRLQQPDDHQQGSGKRRSQQDRE